jgi:hypothetical protein
MDQDFTFPACHLTCLLHVTWRVLFTHYTAPISWPLRHYLVTPVMFLVLVCGQNSHGCSSSCLQSTFIHVAKKFCSPSSFADPESCHPPPNLGAAIIRQQEASPQGRTGSPLSGWNVISQMSPQIVGSNKPPTICVPKTDTQETENLDKAIFSWSRGCKHVLTPTKQHTSTKWLTVASPYIPDTVVPAPHLGFVQVRGSRSPRLAKRLGGWVRACSLVGNGVVQESGRSSKDPLNMQAT